MNHFLNNQRIVGIAFLLLSLGYLFSAQLIPLDFWSETEVFNARSMPYLFGYAGVLTSILLIVLPSPTFDWRSIRSLDYVPAICLFCLLATYGFAIEYLGFLTSTTLLLCAGFYLLGERNVFRLVSIAVGITAVFYTIMNLLGIYFTPGEFWLELVDTVS